MPNRSPLHSRRADAVGVAIDLDGELYVIPITDPVSKTDEQISSEIRRAAHRLRAGDVELKRIHPDDLTITNLVEANIESFERGFAPERIYNFKGTGSEFTGILPQGQIIIHKSFIVFEVFNSRVYIVVSKMQYCKGDIPAVPGYIRPDI